MFFYRRTFGYLNTVICLQHEIKLTSRVTSMFSRRTFSMSADSSQTR